jgi:hypothetical protein
MSNRGCPLEFFLGGGGWGGQVLLRKAKPWIIVGNVFGECYDPCTLNTYFVDLKNNNRHILSPLKANNDAIFFKFLFLKF